MSMNTMQDLLIHELRDLLSAEKQLIKSLPKMVKAATNQRLADAISDHLEETKGQVDRLEECFELLETSARSQKCKGMEGLLAEASDAVEEPDDDNVRDAAIIGASQRVEHYEMAGYGTARAFAKRLGLTEVAALLSKSLEEESAANEKLTKLAEDEVNYEAAGGNGDALATWGKDKESSGVKKGSRTKRATAQH